MAQLPGTPTFFERNSRRSIDALFVLLVHSGRYELLPELYEVFGREKLLQFLEIFGGTTIKVPSEKDLIQAARDVAIYTRLHDAQPGHKDPVDDLCHEYDLCSDEVYTIYREMAQLMDRYDLKKATVRRGS